MKDGLKLVLKVIKGNLVIAILIFLMVVRIES